MAHLICSAEMAIVLLILSGLLVLAWPLLAWGSIFIFDAPSRGLLDDIVRHVMFFGVITYPVGYVRAIWKKEPGKQIGDDVQTLLLLASPFLQLGIVFALGAILGE